jgi:hypothetical protein
MKIGSVGAKVKLADRRKDGRMDGKTDRQMSRISLALLATYAKVPTPKSLRQLVVDSWTI